MINTRLVREHGKSMNINGTPLCNTNTLPKRLL